MNFRRRSNIYSCSENT